MWQKIKALCKRFWSGPEPPVVNTYKDIELEIPDILKPNGVEYRFPDLFKPPKVKFRIKPARK